MKPFEFIKTHLTLVAFFGCIFLIALLLFISALSSLFSKPTTSSDEPIPYIPIKRSVAFPSRVPTPFLIPQVFASSSAKIQFLISPVLLPKTLPAFGVSYQIPDEFTHQLATKLSFPLTPSITVDSREQNVLLYSSATNSSQLQVVPNQGYISLTTEPFFGKTDGQRYRAITKEEANTIARDYLSSIGLLTSGISIESNNSRYESGEQLTNDSQPNQEMDVNSNSYFAVPFTQKINKLTLFYQYGNTGTILVNVNIRGQITGFTYFYQEFSENSQPIPLLTFTQVKNKVLSGNFSVVSPSSENLPSELTQIDFTSLEIGYMSDKKTGFVTPIIILRGLGTDEDNNTYPIIAYLPASR